MSALKVNAFFKKSSPAPKKAAAPAKKAVAPAKKAIKAAPARKAAPAKKTAKAAPAKKSAAAPAGNGRKGWLGGRQGDVLDKWYGEFAAAAGGTTAGPPFFSAYPVGRAPPPHLPPLLPPLSGPNRKLFLPGGLLDPADVPAYLSGTLAGE
jgi:hypothetical protein